MMRLVIIIKYTFYKMQLVLCIYTNFKTGLVCDENTHNLKQWSKLYNFYMSHIENLQENLFIHPINIWKHECELCFKPKLISHCLCNETTWDDYVACISITRCLIYTYWNVCIWREMLNTLYMYIYCHVQCAKNIDNQLITVQHASPQCLIIY